VTIQALSAVLGGTQSLHTNSRDEALSLPTEASVRIALRTQQLIAHESGVAETIDPLGGSWCVEALTSGIERQAREYIDRIDRMGGVIPAVDSGYIQKEIQDARTGTSCRSSGRSRLSWGERLRRAGRKPTTSSRSIPGSKRNSASVWRPSGNGVTALRSGPPWARSSPPAGEGERHGTDPFRGSRLRDARRDLRRDALRLRHPPGESDRLRSASTPVPSTRNGGGPGGTNCTLRPASENETIRKRVI